MDEINQDFPSGLRLTVLFHFDSESVTENKSILPWDWRSLEFEPTECKPIECGDSTDQIHPAATDADLEEETQDDTRADLLMPQDPIKQSKVKGVLRRTVTKFAITAYVLRSVPPFVLRSNLDGFLGA